MKKKKKNQKSNMLKEFKEFALKGNIIDMAIGVVIGGAFQKIVNSLVNDIIMPLISILIGKVDFSDMVLTVGNASIKYGSFITTIVDFLIIAFSIFIAIKYFNKLNKIKDISEEMAVKLDKKGNVKKYIKEKKKEENKEPETKICPYCLTEMIQGNSEESYFNNFTVPDNCVFAMGDNRPGSTDCRSFGCIPLEKIEGKVLFRFWPFSKFGGVK